MSEDVTAGLMASLPKGEGNGLVPHARDLQDYPKRIRVAVILFDAPKTVLDHDKETATIRARIKRIEVITDSEDSAIMQRILMRQFERRTGQTTLPFDLETDIKAAFADVDLNDPDDVALMDMDAEAERKAKEAAEAEGDVPGLRWSDAEQDPTAGPWPGDADAE